MAYDKNVFILGAGASVEAGAPVLNDFLKRARELLDNPRSGLTPDERKSFQNVFKWRGNIYPALRFLKINLENLEDLFSLIDMANLLGIRDAEEIRDDLIRLVLRTLELTIKLDVADDRVERHETYSRFENLLKNWNNQSQNGKTELDGIITLNYDTVIDYALFTLKFTYGPPWEPEPQSQSHNLLKLHGSINWAVCPKCSRKFIMEIFDPKLREHIKLYDAKHVHMIPATNAFTSPCPKCNNPFLRPFIVPPTWNKPTYGEYLQPVWQSAHKELIQATRLIIIGYSLPQTDSFFKYLLALGLSENESLQEIILIDPAKADAKESLEKRYQEFIAPYFDIQGFTFWNVPFSLGVRALEFKRCSPRASNEKALEAVLN